MTAHLPIPVVGEVYLFADYYLRLLGYSRHARGWQVHLQVVGQTTITTAGLSEFMVGSRHQKRY